MRTCFSNWAILGVGCVIALAVAAVLWYRLGGEKPAASFDRNASRQGVSVDSAADYVGYQRCAECHPENADLHVLSGHARTFRQSGTLSTLAALDGVQFDDADRDVDFRYRWTAEGLSALLDEQFPERDFPLPFAFGSGMHAITFLTLVPDITGQTVGVQHRVSIYGDLELARTPGATAAAPREDVEYFGEIVTGDRLNACIGCHTTTWQITDDDRGLTDLRPNVQCERCHGPGSQHVAAMERGQTEMKINFVPGRRTALEEIRMCGECHRLPEMLSDTKLERTNAKIARYQSVGLLQSACFKESSEQLRCTTCHNPHQRADALSRTEYSAMCRDCHQQRHVGECPKAAISNCITCHMPRVEVHPRVAFHDHWIRIRDNDDPATIETHEQR